MESEMQSNRRVFKPTVDGCESRELLSSGLLRAPSAWLARASAIKVIQLGGTITGHYVQNTINPDVGSVFTLNGSGNVNGFGKAFASSSLQSIGFIANGTARGVLVLAGPKGTLTLNLTGATHQNGPAGLPSSFTFKTSVGTGKFWNVHDQGTVSLVLSPKKTFNSFNPVTSGTFSFVLTSYPVPTPSATG
jgi:hypothetical protein